MTDKKRILIAYSSTGGGHLAAGRALKESFIAQYGEESYDVELLDLWKDHAPRFLGKIADSYPDVVETWLYRAVWRFTHSAIGAALVFGPSSVFVRRGFRRLFAQRRPDAIISVHPCLNKPVLDALAPSFFSRGKAISRIPFFTVVTDPFTIHRSWVDNRADSVFVSSQEAKEAALKFGATEKQVRVTGHPIRASFLDAYRTKEERAILKTELGLQANAPVVLVMSGGDGGDALIPVVQDLDDNFWGSGGQIVVVCGRDEKTRKTLARMPWRGDVTVLGFVNDLDRWMSAADIAVTKAGPGSVFECLAAGLPMILFKHFSPQEDGNVAFVERNGLGQYAHVGGLGCATVNLLRRKIPETLRRLARFKSMPRASSDIVSAIHAFLRKPES